MANRRRSIVRPTWGMRPLIFSALMLTLALVTGLAMAAPAERSRVVAQGLNHPWSVCLGFKDRLFATEIGARLGDDSDGRVVVIDDGRPVAFATGLRDPRGMVYYRDTLFVVDGRKIVKIDEAGHATDYMVEANFPSPPQSLRDIAVDRRNGIFLLSDHGDASHAKTAIYRVDIRLNTIESLLDEPTAAMPNSEIGIPRGLNFECDTFAALARGGKDGLLHIRLADHATVPFAPGIEEPESMVWDHEGRLFVTRGKSGAVVAIPRPGERPVKVAGGLSYAAGACLDVPGKKLNVVDAKAGKIVAVSTTIPGWEVDDSPLPIEPKPAFTQLEWTGWDSGAESGKVSPLRPIVLTAAGDKSNRLFVATQQGVVHVFDNSDSAAKTQVVLDISDRVRYSDMENEEGLLGLALHPKFASNGEFFVFYTTSKAPLTNIVSRFRMRAGSPGTADPASEEQLLRIEKPYWNHDGGSLVFGPDGYLYISHGDGGLANDPRENGQNLATLLGKVLRIDVDKRSADKPYAIPSDNPFVKQPNAAPEVWAYGLRNVWRMAFDRQTGALWAGDVGQNLFEEIDILTAGGNYGWSLRESLHPFGAKGVDARPDLIDPIWEYDHDLGKSITGGLVYRGKRLPGLTGAYIYADYVTARLWALRYDPKERRVVANHPLKNPGLAIMSFGEDADGEIYLLSAALDGRGIHRLDVSTEAK